MKKWIPAFALFLALFLTACAGQAAAHANQTGTQPEGLTMLDANQWPENDYTQGLPVPPGAVAWAMLDETRENCSACITQIPERDYLDYMAQLKQAGFSVMEEVSESVQGQDYISVGTLLSNGEKALSISYIPGQLTLYISFQK